jgi:hypothetical protein
MKMARIKTYLFVFGGIFVFLMFMTWQQVAIFRLGYRVTGLREKIKDQQIENQYLLQGFNRKCSLFKVEQKAGNSFEMVIPESTQCRVLKLDKEKLSVKERESRSLLTSLKEILSPSDAQAR